MVMGVPTVNIKVYISIGQGWQTHEANLLNFNYSKNKKIVIFSDAHLGMWNTLYILILTFKQVTKKMFTAPSLLKLNNQY